MKQQAVITGIGVVLPGVMSLEALWQTQLQAATAIRPLSSRLHGSRIDEADLGELLPSRLAKKLDAFTRYALIASEFALNDARVELDTLDKTRSGVFVGNAFGGWRFTENELRHLHNDGPRAVSPFQATSWFPAAPQGQITIHYGFKGHSKTLMADRASGLHSVAAAAQQIEKGGLDLAIAGGCESTNTDFVRTALENFGSDDGDAALYAPLSTSASRFAVSEGAVFLVLENATRAQQRGAYVYANVDGFAIATKPCAADRYQHDSATMMRAMSKALNGAYPDVVMPDACGVADADAVEALAIAEIAGRAAIALPKVKFGHGYGMEGALDIAYACLMLQKQQRLPTQIDTPLASLKTLRHSKTVNAAELDRILINGCASGGSCSSLLLSKGKTKS